MYPWRGWIAASAFTLGNWGLSDISRPTFPYPSHLSTLLDRPIYSSAHISGNYPAMKWIHCSDQWYPWIPHLLRDQRLTSCRSTFPLAFIRRDILELRPLGHDNQYVISTGAHLHGRLISSVFTISSNPSPLSPPAFVVWRKGKPRVVVDLRKVNEKNHPSNNFPVNGTIS